jgi:hypothetical protein
MRMPPSHLVEYQQAIVLTGVAPSLPSRQATVGTTVRVAIWRIQ